MKELPNPTMPLSLIDIPRGHFIETLLKLKKLIFQTKFHPHEPV